MVSYPQGRNGTGKIMPGSTVISPFSSVLNSWLTNNFVLILCFIQTFKRSFPWLYAILAPSTGHTPSWKATYRVPHIQLCIFCWGNNLIIPMISKTDQFLNRSRVQRIRTWGELPSITAAVRHGRHPVSGSDEQWKYSVISLTQQLLPVFINVDLPTPGHLWW